MTPFIGFVLAWFYVAGMAFTWHHGRNHVFGRFMRWEDAVVIALWFIFMPLLVLIAWLFVNKAQNG